MLALLLESPRLCHPSCPHFSTIIFTSLLTLLLLASRQLHIP